MAGDTRAYLKGLLTWLALVAGAFLFWHWAASYLLPLLLGLFLAVLVEPLVRLGERIRVPRPAGAALGLVAALGAAGAALAALVSLIAVEVGRLLTRLPDLYQGAQHALDGFATHIMGLLAWNPPNAESLLNSHLLTAYQLLMAVLGAFLNAVAGVPNLLAVTVMALLAAYFLMRDKESLEGAGDWLAPPRLARGAPQLRREVVRGTLGFVRAQLLLVLMTASTTTLGLTLYGSRYALVLGLVAGLLDLIPFLGPTALLGPWALVLVVTGHPLAALALTAVLVGAVLVRQLAEPKMVAQGTGLHPLTALMAAYLGLRLLGPLGFVLGPITAVTLKAVGRALGLPPFETS